MNFSSSITYEKGALKNLDFHFAHLKEYSQLVFLTDQRVEAIYGADVRAALKKLNRPYLEIVIPEGEKSKSLAQASDCWEKMFFHGIDRHAALIALGGGVICDLGGFISSCYMRGIDAYYIPTTLMAMIDAALGGKTAVNLPAAKNMIGSFHLPKQILMDPNCLLTLSQREFNAGLAEMIKYGLTIDASLFEELEEKIESLLDRQGSFLDRAIQKCVHLKNALVSEDFKDLSGQRAKLNYGHTFGHALEAATDYQRFLHGEAVAIGMSCAAHLSGALALCNEPLIHRQDQLCKRANLPIQFTSLPIDLLMKTISRDKKAICGKINLILIERIGKVVKVCDVNPELIKKVLNAKMG